MYFTDFLLASNYFIPLNFEFPPVAFLAHFEAGLVRFEAVLGRFETHLAFELVVNKGFQSSQLHILYHSELHVYE